MENSSRSSANETGRSNTAFSYANMSKVKTKKGVKSNSNTNKKCGAKNKNANSCIVKKKICESNPSHKDSNIDLLLPKQEVKLVANNRDSDDLSDTDTLPYAEDVDALDELNICEEVDVEGETENVFSNHTIEYVVEDTCTENIEPQHMLLLDNQMLTKNDSSPVKNQKSVFACSAENNHKQTANENLLDAVVNECDVNFLSDTIVIKRKKPKKLASDVKLQKASIMNSNRSSNCSDSLGSNSVNNFLCDLSIDQSNSSFVSSNLGNSPTSMVYENNCVTDVSKNQGVLRELERESGSNSQLNVMLERTVVENKCYSNERLPSATSVSFLPSSKNVYLPAKVELIASPTATATVTINCPIKPHNLASNSLVKPSIFVSESARIPRWSDEKMSMNPCVSFMSLPNSASRMVKVFPDAVGVTNQPNMAHWVGSSRMSMSQSEVSRCASFFSHLKNHKRSTPKSARGKGKSPILGHLRQNKSMTSAAHNLTIQQPYTSSSLVASVTQTTLNSTDASNNVITVIGDKPSLQQKQQMISMDSQISQQPQHFEQNLQAHLLQPSPEQLHLSTRNKSFSNLQQQVQQQHQMERQQHASQAAMGLQAQKPQHVLQIQGISPPSSDNRSNNAALALPIVRTVSTTQTSTAVGPMIAQLVVANNVMPPQTASPCKTSFGNIMSVLQAAMSGRSVSSGTGASLLTLSCATSGAQVLSLGVGPNVAKSSVTGVVALDQTKLFASAAKFVGTSSATPVFVIQNTTSASLNTQTTLVSAVSHSSMSTIFSKSAIRDVTGVLDNSTSNVSVSVSNEDQKRQPSMCQPDGKQLTYADTYALFKKTQEQNESLKGKDSNTTASSGSIVNLSDGIILAGTGNVLSPLPPTDVKMHQDVKSINDAACVVVNPSSSLIVAAQPIGSNGQQLSFTLTEASSVQNDGALLTADLPQKRIVGTKYLLTYETGKKITATWNGTSFIACIQPGMSGSDECERGLHQVKGGGNRDGKLKSNASLTRVSLASVRQSLSNLAASSAPVTRAPDAGVMKQKQVLIPKQETGKYAICEHCGNISANYKTCDSCHRILSDSPRFYFLSEAKQSSNSSASETNTTAISTGIPHFYGKTAIQNQMVPRQLSRPTIRRALQRRPKNDETVTVLSSDEDEDGQPKKSRLSPENEGLDLFASSAATSKSAISRFQKMEDATGKLVLSQAKLSTLKPNQSVKANDSENLMSQMYQLRCQYVQIGAHGIHSASVLLSAGLITITASEKLKIVLPIQDIMKIEHCFSPQMSILFLQTTPTCSERLRAQFKQEASLILEFDPTSRDHRKCWLIMLFNSISLSDCTLMKAALNRWAGGGRIVIELDLDKASNLLVESTPSTPVAQIVNRSNCDSSTIIDDNDADNQDRSRSPSPIHTFSQPVIKLFTYPPPPATGGIAVTNEDLYCLRDSEFLNDVIIDFYLKYLQTEILTEVHQKATYIFSSFFYRRLMQKSSRQSEEAPTIQLRRYNRVKTWTKNVDLFSKDFVIIPVNESAHWYLAIICFPHLVNSCNSTTINSDNTEMSDENQQTEPSQQTDLDLMLSTESIKRPCILIFDSLAGPARSGTVRIFREYLQEEWNARKASTDGPRVFDKDTIKGFCPKCPQQCNFSDCGVYVLQYVESFFKNPIVNYESGHRRLENWFSEATISKKRYEISHLICELQKKYNPSLTYDPVADGCMDPPPLSQLTITNACSITDSDIAVDEAVDDSQVLTLPTV